MGTTRCDVESALRVVRTNPTGLPRTEVESAHQDHLQTAGSGRPRRRTAHPRTPAGRPGRRPGHRPTEDHQQLGPRRTRLRVRPRHPAVVRPPGLGRRQRRFHAWPAGGNPPTPAPDASIAGPAAGQSTTIRMPKFSGRIYFSYGQKLDFRLTTGGLVQPAVQNPSDPNRDILFNWSEYTLNDSGLWLNSTQVDMFSAPYAVGVQRLRRGHQDHRASQVGRLHRLLQRAARPARRLGEPDPDPRPTAPCCVRSPRCTASRPARSRPASWTTTSTVCGTKYATRR